MPGDEFRERLAGGLAEIARIGIIAVMHARHRQGIDQGRVNAERAHGFDERLRIAVLAQRPRGIGRTRAHQRTLIFGQDAMVMHVDETQARAGPLLDAHVFPHNLARTMAIRPRSGKPPVASPVV